LCQEKKNLYELLDTSQGGIAEWILPIVFAGGLDEVFWIKNEWCHQFQNGCYEFHVGAYWDEDDDDGSEKTRPKSSLRTHGIVPNTVAVAATETRSRPDTRARDMPPRSPPRDARPGVEGHARTMERDVISKFPAVFLSLFLSK
jgi:hypothetical protein